MHFVRRALVASPAPEAAESLLRAAGFETMGCARTAGAALALLERIEVDLLLADAVLPGMDGPALAEAVISLPLRVHPAVVLAAPAGLRVPGGEELAPFSAVLLEKPFGPAELAAAFDSIVSLPPALPPRKTSQLAALLDALGVPAHPGREALAAAAALAWQDGRRLANMKRRLYPAVGRVTGMTSVQAERAIRYAIDAAWRTGAIEAQNRIFGDTIDAKRGRPTCGEMIARLADILRWEGR